MAPPPAVLQRAVLVAVPLALLVLIFVTPGLMGRQASPTALPAFLAQVAKQPWNATYNETAFLYVWSPLGVTIYDYLAINATGVGNYTGTSWSASGARLPSIVLKFPVNATRMANVTAVAIDAFSIYRFNATIEFKFDHGWSVRGMPEKQASFGDWVPSYSTPMRREARP